MLILLYTNTKFELLGDRFYDTAKYREDLELGGFLSAGRLTALDRELHDAGIDVIESDHESFWDTMVHAMDDTEE